MGLEQGLRHLAGKMPYRSRRGETIHDVMRVDREGNPASSGEGMTRTAIEGWAGGRVNHRLQRGRAFSSARVMTALSRGEPLARNEEV